MKLHELKIEEIYFIDVQFGKKKAELRYNDRNFKENDLIHFVQTDGTEFSYCNYNLFTITHVLKDAELYGLAKGWVLLSIERLQ